MVFNFKEDYILEDDIVRLRPLQITDYNHLLEYSVNEPEIWQFNSGGANGAENLKEYIATTVRKRQEGTEYRFIVYDKRVGKYIGSTGFYDIQLWRHVAELGFTWYGLQYQGTGINKHCKYLLLQFAFEKMNLDRVGFRANNLNERSKNAMKSIGCKEEGVLRNVGTDAAGNRIDSIVLSILKNEWHEEVKTKLKGQLLK